MKRKKRRNSPLYNFLVITLQIIMAVGTGALLYFLKDFQELSTSIITLIDIILISLNVLVLVFTLSAVTQRTGTFLKIFCVFFELVFIAVIAIGGYYLYETMSTVHDIVDDGENSDVKYSMVYVTYGETNITDLSKMTRNTRLGYIDNEFFIEGNIMALKVVENNNIASELVGFSNYVDIIMNLVKGNIDVAALPASYSTTYVNDDVCGSYIDSLNVIYSYEDTIETAGIGGNDIDVTSEPFTILFMGCDGARSDSLILVSVNPKTLTVTMTSIPRDSYVPIACYKNNESDKITHAHAVSRGCTIDTVSNYFDVDVDFYIDVNFDAVVQIVDAMGGLWLNLDKDIYEYWNGITHEAGMKLRNGTQVLAIARERYSLENGDYDREDNQRNVIKALLNQLLSLRDPNVALNILKAAGSNLNTNFSVKQLFALFNLGLDSLTNTEIGQTVGFDMYTILSSRITGYSDWFYSYDYELPLWTMHPYKGSVADSKELINSNINGTLSLDTALDLGFDIADNYRNTFIIKETYDEKREYNELPDYTPDFIDDYTPKEVSEWANEYGKKLVINEVKSGSSMYRDSYEHNTIIAQSPSYGRLLSLYDTLEIWVIKKDIDCTLAENQKYDDCQDGSYIPNFTGMTVNQVKSWLNIVDASSRPELEIVYVDNDGEDIPDAVKRQSPAAGTAVYTINKITVYISRYPYSTLPVTSFIDMTKAEVESWFNKNWKTQPKFEYWYTSSTKIKEGNVSYVYRGNSKLSSDALLRTNDEITIYLNKIYLKNMVGMKYSETDKDKSQVGIHFQQLGLTSYASHIVFVDTDDKSLDMCVKSQNLDANKEYTKAEIDALSIEIYKYKGE